MSSHRPELALLGQLRTAEARRLAVEAERLYARAAEAKANGDVAGAAWFEKLAKRRVALALMAESGTKLEPGQRWPRERP